MAGIRLTGNFFDINGLEHQVDIYDADFSGAATEFDVKYCRITYDSEDSNNPAASMIGSRADIGMTVDYEDTVLPTFIEDFASGAEDRFFVQIKQVISAAIIWRGILTPDFSGEEDTSPLYVFRVSAICGLATLKKTPYHSGSAIYTGIDRFTRHLVVALGKCAHTDIYWDMDDVFMKTTADWWAVDMAFGTTDDPLFQGGVDHAAFYDYKTEGDIDKDVLSCYDVISNILRTFNCRIYQSDGSWWIEQIPYRTASTYYARHYAKTGLYVANSTNTGVNDIDQTATGAKLATIQYDFLPALEKAQVTYDVRMRRNFLAGTRIRQGDYNGDFDTQISASGGTAIMRLRFTIFYAVQNDSFLGPVQTQFFIAPKVILKIGANYLKRTYSVTNFSAQVGQLEWTTTATDGVYVPIFLGTVPVAPGEKSGQFAVDLLVPALPTDGDDNAFGTDVFSAEMLRVNGTAVDETEFNIAIKIENQYLEIYDQGTPIVNEDKIQYTAENNVTATEDYETTTRIGTADLANSAGRIMRWNGSAWVVAGDWGQGVETRDKAIGDLLALNLLNARLTPLRRMNGSLYGTFGMRRLLTTTDGKKWMMSNAEWDVAGNTLRGTWFELNYGEDGVSTSPVKIKTLPSTTTPVANSPSSPGPGTSSATPGFYTNSPPTVLAPIAYNTTTAAIDEGDTITSLTLGTASNGNEFLPGDTITLVDPVTGQYQNFTVATAPGVGDTTISVISDTADFDSPEGSYLVVRQNAFAFSLPTATQGQILRYNGSTDEWEAYSGTTDGHVLTWDTTNGWQSEAGGSGTVTSVAATAPAAGFTISGSPITGSGTFVFALANDLAAVEGLSGTGIAVRTASDTWTTRTVAAGTGISIADGDGVSGNPTITNTAPDQTVSLTAGSGISITGTYPSFTIAATGGGDFWEVGGNTEGAALIGGTNDDFALSLETNNVTRFTISSGATTGGDITMAGVTANTNTVQERLAIKTNSTGVAAAGLGGGIGFYTESTTTNDRLTAELNAYWLTATDASRDGEMIIRFPQAGTMRNAYKFGGGGTGFSIFNTSGAGPVIITTTSLTHNAAFTVGGTSAALTVGGSTGTLTLNSNESSNTALTIAAVNNTGSIKVGVTSFSLTTLAKKTMYFGDNYTAASGTGTLTAMAINNTYNLTGTASGAQIGIDIAPTLTSLTAATYTGLNLNFNHANSFGINQIGELPTNRFDGRVFIERTTAGTGSNNAFLNLNGGAITGDTDVLRASANISSQMIAVFANARNLSSTGDVRIEAQVGGTSAGDPYFASVVPSGSTTVWGNDNSDGDKFKITPGGTKPGSTVDHGLIMTHDAVTLVGINKDAPKHPLDVDGRARSTQFVGLGNAWTSGNISFGAGAGTGPTLNSVSGTGNYLIITFTTGTTPAANSQVFTATYPTAFPQGPSCAVFTTGNDQDVNIMKIQTASDTAVQVNSKNGSSLTASTQYKLYMMFGGFDN